MAFLTKLNSKDINKICINYNFVNYKKLTPIYEGIQNSNYIFYDSKKYILTLYEDKEVVLNLDKYIKLLLFLEKVGFFAPVPIMNKNKNFISSLDKKKYAIFTFIRGKYLKKPLNNHIKVLGNNLGKMHNETKKFSINIKNNFNLSYLNKNIIKYKKYIQSYDKKLIYLFKNCFTEFSKIHKYDLPKGIIHADLFPDNILFDKGKISGFLDFYYSCNHYLITDLAIILLSWCFSYRNNKLLLNLLKTQTFLIEYNKCRKLTMMELKLLNLFCKIYCIRFFITRLNDLQKNYNPKFTQIKDPNEYLNKFMYFENNTLDFRKIIIGK